MASTQPNRLHRRMPWVAERSLRHEPTERLRKSVRQAKTNVFLNSFFAVVNIATGKAVFLVMMVPVIAHSAHKWYKLHKDPSPFHVHDTSLRALVATYREEVAGGTWQGLPEIPIRLLVAPLVGLQTMGLIWTMAHPAVTVSVSAGVAAGILWFVGALLSITLGVRSKDLSFSL